MWPVISKFSVLLACIGAALTAAAAASAPDPDADALLAGMLPDHLAYQNSLISAVGGRPAPAELLGFDAQADGERLTGTPLTYSEGSLLALDLYWIPRAAPPPNASVTIRIRGSGRLIQQTYPLDTSGWQFGVLSRQHVELQHVRGWYSGKGVLTVALGPSEAEPEYVLYRGPLFIRTSAGRSKVDTAGLRGMFGQDLTPLNKAFRLGEGASVSVGVPANTAQYRAVVIVSATGYDGAPAAGEGVCEVKAGECLRRALKTGVDTAPLDPAQYDQLGGDRLAVKVFQRGTESMNFVTVLGFDRPCRPGEIVFRYLKNKGVIDVKELALLKAKEANGNE